MGTFDRLDRPPGPDPRVDFFQTAARSTSIRQASIFRMPSAENGLAPGRRASSSTAGHAQFHDAGTPNESHFGQRAPRGRRRRDWARSSLENDVPERPLALNPL